MNPDLDKLQKYPFERLAQLNAAVTPADLPSINMSIGEPKHGTPELIQEAVAKALQDHLTGFSRYPSVAGSRELRESIANWLTRRFKLQPGAIDPEKNVLPVNGTREALFAFAQAAVPPSVESLVLMPNPFYQIYEGAALLAGASPYFINSTTATKFLPDFDSVPDSVWRRCELLYICSPGNPIGAVYDKQTLQRLLALAERFDFMIASDECYSEIYFDDSAPTGLLEVCTELGLHDFKRCIVFHSLSKRSSVPGMRSGFVAGDSEIIKHFHLYRTYHGCAMSPVIQAASIAAWNDENHVIENRLLYKEKFDAIMPILAEATTELQRPQGGFFLWLQTPYDDTLFTQRLLEHFNLLVVPGSYMSRQANGINPGTNNVRIAIVDPVETCAEGAKRLRDFLSE
jgi:N-succinyldiaminopimelate aminotransferase